MVTPPRTEDRTPPGDDDAGGWWRDPGEFDEPIATLDDAFDAVRAKRAQRLRRIGLSVLMIPVLLAAFGVFGPSTGTNRVTGQGIGLQVEHPRATRSSVATPLTIKIIRPDGFGASPVTLSIDTALMDRLDFQNWYPNPSAERGRDTVMEYEFDPPDGQILEIHLDARTGPNQGFSRERYRIAVLADGATLAETSFRMVVWP